MTDDSFNPKQIQTVSPNGPKPEKDWEYTESGYMDEAGFAMRENNFFDTLKKALTKNFPKMLDPVGDSLAENWSYASPPKPKNVEVKPFLVSEINDFGDGSRWEEI